MGTEIKEISDDLAMALVIGYMYGYMWSEGDNLPYELGIYINTDV